MVRTVVMAVVEGAVEVGAVDVEEGEEVRTSVPALLVSSIDI